MQNIFDSAAHALRDPEDEKSDTPKSVARMFFLTGLQVFFAGVWYVLFRRLFGAAIVG